MTDGNTWKTLAAAMRRLEENLAAQRNAQALLSRTSLVFGIVILAVIACFLALNVAKVRAEFTAEKVSKSLEKELAEFGPTALRELSVLGRDVLPVYLEEWQKQFTAAWPEISAKLERELGRLSDNMTGRLHETLAAMEERSLEKVRRVLAKHYPELSDPSQQAELAKRVHTHCEKALEESLLEFDRMFSKDVQRLQDVVFSFDVKDGDESTVDLQKRFLRLWLQLLDQEITRI